MSTPNPNPPLGAGDHLVEAKTALAGGAHQTAIAHALIAIAETFLVSQAAAAIDEVTRQVIATLTAALNPAAGCCTCQPDDLETLRWCAVHGDHERGGQ